MGAILHAFVSFRFCIVGTLFLCVVTCIAWLGSNLYAEKDLVLLQDAVLVPCLLFCLSLSFNAFGMEANPYTK